MATTRADPSTTPNELLEHVLDTMTDAHLVLDEAWRVIYANPRAEHLLEMSHRDLMDRTVWELFPAAQGTSLEAALRLQMGRTEQSAPDTWVDSRHHALAVHAARIPEGVVLTLRDTGELVSDPLTGLPNRRGFDRELEALLDQPGSWPISVLFIDLDRFKVVNDSLGHRAGDALLVEASRRLREAVRPQDLVGRHDSDKFAVACPNTDIRDTMPICEHILAEFRQPFTIDGHTLSIIASIGVRGATAASTTGTILRDADATEQASRTSGTGSYAFFSQGTRVDALHRLEVEDELSDAIHADDIVLHWQPAFDLATGEIAGIEGLARWHHAARGLLQPGAFIPIAEETDLILELGRHTLIAGVRQARAWRSQLGRPCADFGSVWVNVSARELCRPSFPDEVAAVLDAVGLPAADLGLEITESALFADPVGPIENLARLSALGVRLALDDFGTGHSSLTYLLHFPVDIVKIDQSFTAEVHDPTKPHRAIVEAVITATHALGGLVLAEGVEDHRQLEVLTDLGCDAASGYLLARPAPAREVTPLLPGGDGAAGAPDLD